MRIAFRLVNDKSRDFINCLIKNQELELLCFVDGNENKWGEVDCESGIPYISPYKFLDMYEKNKVDKIVISPYSGAYTALDVANEMISMGIPTEAILLPAIPDIDEKVPHLEKEPPYLEVFSPTYVSENTSRVPFPDIDESSVRTPIFSFPVRSKIQTAEIQPPLSSSRPA